MLHIYIYIYIHNVTSCLRVGAGIALPGLITQVHSSEIMRMVSQSSILEPRASWGGGAALWGVFQNAPCGVVDPLFGEFVMFWRVALWLCFGIWAGSRCVSWRVLACRCVSQDARKMRARSAAAAQDGRKMRGA